ncbi:M1 family metallopeptidase [Flagellimonas sp.]|uniref:M1 family metallopeptidase n=1 Tax=Flagellimonas sp. TaxID=2058762 RepID=UPI003F4A7357
MKSFPLLVFLLLVGLSSAQIQDKVDFTRAKVHIHPEPYDRSISGKVEYEFNVLQHVDSIFLDAVDIDFSSVMLNGKPIKYVNTGKTIVINKRLKKDGEYTLSLTYSTSPKQTVYFSRWEVPDTLQSDNSTKDLQKDYARIQKSFDEKLLGALNRENGQIWTQGQGKYTSHWLPSLDDMNDKIEFDLSVTFNSLYQVIANGKLVMKEDHGSETIWTFNMQKPMSSYLVAFGIGNYSKQTIQSTSGIPIELYYEPQDSLKVEPTYRFTKEIFDFLENEIGIPYPWQNYKQIPVHDFLYAGMENTGATIFSNTFMVDSVAFTDKNYVNVNAHELAHQWFGNMVTEQSGNHHWLHEGFATYYAYLAEKELFGADYFYWKLYETATSLYNFSKDGNGEALTNPNAGSLTFYEKGAWALAILREKVGEEAFKEGVRNYLLKYAYQNVTIADFMWEMRKASGMKLINFEETWLANSEFPIDLAENYLLAQCKSLEAYFIIKKTKEKSTNNLANGMIQKYWDISDSYHFKRQVILDFAKDIPEEKLIKMTTGEEPKVRQALALSELTISPTLKPVFESLLSDESYVTQEAILYRLWSQFPESRFGYLDETSNIVGLPNKNVRMLWLALALATPDYKDEQKRNFYEELSGYTHPQYHFEVRLLAFQYLKNLGGFSDSVLKNLINACNHHVWYFKKSARKYLKEFLKGEGNKDRLKSIYTLLNQQEKAYLDKTLSK